MKSEKSIKMRLSWAKFSLDKILPRTKISLKLSSWSDVSLNNCVFEHLSIRQLSPWTDVSFETSTLNKCFATISHDSAMPLFSSSQKISMLFLNPPGLMRAQIYSDLTNIFNSKNSKNMEKCARIFLRWKGTQSHAFHTLFSNYPLSFRDTTKIFFSFFKDFLFKSALDIWMSLLSGDFVENLKLK